MGNSIYFRRLLHFLVATWSYTIILVVPKAVAFGSFPPPRFDNFSDRLIGSWTRASDGAKQSVEEVMRSCGGAVQGIREPLDGENAGDNDDGSLYLNRANDGFLFLDNGCYSFGPVNQQRDGNFYLSNFMIGTTTRLVVSSTMQPDGDDSSVVTIGTLQTKTPFGEEAHSKKKDAELETVLKLVDTFEQLPSIYFGGCRIIKCSMPSSGQPWMLQRAKWQKKDGKESSSSSKEDGAYNNASRRILYWSFSQPAKVFFDWIGISEVKNVQKSCVVIQGIVSETTGIASATARHYTNDNVLENVLFLEGRLHHQEMELINP